MRAISLFLGVMVLGGCAAAPKPQPCSKCGDAPARASLLQRLGFGRPIGEKGKAATIETVAPETGMASDPLIVESGPTLTVEPVAPQQNKSPSTAVPK